MPTPPLSEAMAREAVQRVEDRLRLGDKPQNFSGPGKSAVRAAAEIAVADGWCNNTSTFETRVRIGRETYRLEPDWSIFRPRVYQHAPPGLPVIPSQDHVQEPEPEGDPIRVAVIGDAHDSPHLPDKSRFRWLGRYIADRGLEQVVSVGDWMTMDCFSSHTDRATFEGRAKPTFEQDLDSFHQSMRAFHEGLAGHKPKLRITLGNHENRAWRYDNQHPDGLSHGLLLEQAFAQWGWQTSPYGEYRFICGVGFTHVPLNGLGRAMAQTQRVNKAMFDIIHGDDHRASQVSDYKAGPVRSPTVYSAATALPCGFVEGFANRGGSTWRSGICEATLWDGYVRSWSFTEMTLLRRQYA